MKFTIHENYFDKTVEVDDGLVIQCARLYVGRSPHGHLIRGEDNEGDTVFCRILRKGDEIWESREYLVGFATHSLREKWVRVLEE